MPMTLQLTEKFPPETRPGTRRSRPETLEIQSKSEKQMLHHRQRSLMGNTTILDGYSLRPYSDQVFDTLIETRTNAGNIDDIFDTNKCPVLFTVFDDLLRGSGTDTWKSFQFHG